MKKQRFEIIAKDFTEEKNLTTEVIIVVKELQAKNIPHIEVLDHERKEITVYRKGTQDKNYFVRTRDMPTPGEGDSSTATDSNTGDNEDQVSEVPQVDNKRKGRSVNKE